ncbi:MAG: polyprenyl synthetase family protein [Bacteroidia bacterium]|nr:polyprenyl synthetase family protein [Bacteroidia bacterium]MCX7651881.1 polyprenyl synthetase family protein [Bacteroidia bacterium]MDW8416032.1 polyprenyl synthetase family protein [Bacteroidia bacterium]
MWQSDTYEKSLSELSWPYLGKWAQWMDYAVGGGGKRLRPYLVWRIYEFYAGESASWERALPLMRSIELLHTFTLVHDDVMDKSQLRRGKPTLYHLTDENTAILIGDALLIGVYQELMNLPPESCKRVASILSTAALRVCHGQLLDLELGRQPTASVTEASYFEMIKEKTGALIGAALEAGAALAQAPIEECERLRLIGESIGVYFQAQDDYLDAFGDHTGKSRGGDIVEGKKTFLWLWAWNEATEEDRSRLENMHGEERRLFGLALYESLGLRERGEVFLKEVRQRTEELLIGVSCHALIREILHRLEGRSR